MCYSLSVSYFICIFIYYAYFLTNAGQWQIPFPCDRFVVENEKSNNNGIYFNSFSKILMWKCFSSEYDTICLTSHYSSAVFLSPDGRLLWVCWLSLFQESRLSFSSYWSCDNSHVDCICWKMGLQNSRRLCSRPDGVLATFRRRSLVKLSWSRISYIGFVSLLFFLMNRHIIMICIVAVLSYWVSLTSMRCK